MITLTNGGQIPENAVQLQTTAAIDGYYVAQPLRLVQYDQTLPVAAVQLVYQSQPYIPPTGAELNVRMVKSDGTTVYNPCLGVDSSGIVYFVFTQQMTAAAGDGKLTVEVTDSGVKNSAPITVNVAENPVQEGSIESADEFLTLQEILQQAEQWGQIVQANASNIQQVVDNLPAIEAAPEAAQQAAASAAAAQQAAQEALGFRTFFSAVTPDTNGNLDPSRPMTVGPAASVEIESAGDRIQSVTALGFTQQAGAGDPSPANVRALTNGGLKLVVVTFDGSGDENWLVTSTDNTVQYINVTYPATGASYVTILGICDKLEKVVPTENYGNPTEVGTCSMFAQPSGAAVFKIKIGASNAEQAKQMLAANPITLWYQPADEADATGLYAPIIIQSGEYRATCLPLTAPLCEGDSVVSWVKSGCDQQLTLDGSTLTVAASGSNYTVVAANAVAGGTVYASGLAGLSLTAGSITIPGTAFPASVTNAGQANTWLQSNPQTLYYQSTAYTEADDIAVSLETHQMTVSVLNGAESISAAGSAGVGGYNYDYTVLPKALTGTTSALKCSHYKSSSASLNSVFVTATGTIRFTGIEYDNVSDFKSYLAAQYAAGTPVTIVYELAPPITYAHPAVVLEAATGDQLTYTVTGQSGGTVSVALKPFQDGGHAKTADNATQFDGHAWSEVPGQAPVQSVNSKTGAVMLAAEDVGAQPAITFQTLSPTKGPTVNSNYSTACRYGQVCFVSVSLSLTSAPSAYDRNTVLLSGLPPAAQACGATVYEQSDGLSHYMQVGTDGALKLYVSAKGFTAEAPFLWGGLSYPIAEGS